MTAPTIRGALFGHVLPGPAVRARRLPWLFEGTLRQCRRHGQILVEGGDATAGWVPGGHLALGALDLLRSALVERRDDLASGLPAWIMAASSTGV